MILDRIIRTEVCQRNLDMIRRLQNCTRDSG